MDRINYSRVISPFPHFRDCVSVVFSDRGTGAAEMEVDRLGALPEPLLLDIIRRLGCWKGAARTAVLSKQWRFLWTNLPFPFSCRSKDTEEKRRFAAGVHAALALRRGPALESLSLYFYYDRSLASDVDSWLDFAAKNKVKNVDLGLLIDHYLSSRSERYDLPPAIYSNSSLAAFSLEHCPIASVTTPVEWRRLKSLRLNKVDFLHQQAIGEILSGCPLLETLTLYMCYGFSRLEIGSRSFRYLSVTYYSGRSEGSLEICAPCMKHLHICEMGVSSVGRSVWFENVGSLESAGFDLSSSLNDDSMEAIVTTMEKFLHLGRSLKEVSLGYGFGRALSMMATHRWQFAHPMKVEVLSLSGAKPCGVVAMLESCPFVQELVVDCYVPEEVEVSIKYGPITRDDLHCDLMHLKTVKFEEYFEPGNSGEPMLTVAKILLRRAPNMEKMVIYKTDVDPDSMKELDDLKNALLQFPRSSHKATIEIW